MKYKIILSIPLYLSFIQTTLGQPQLNFDKKIHDFEEIIEGTIARYEFHFTNSGTEPLIIKSVRASCGCTTPYWTSDPVKPGGKGIISAAYNSTRRPGSFNKSITVVSNASQNTITLQIKGMVLDQDQLIKNTQEISFNENVQLNIKERKINLGRLQQNQLIPVTITAGNSGSENLQILSVISDCNCIVFEKKEAISIPPGGKIDLDLIYRPGNVGSREEKLHIFTNQANAHKETILLQAEIVKSLSDQNMLKEGSEVYKF